MADWRTSIRDAYAVEGDALDLGRAVHEGGLAADVPILVPLRSLNRHGLIAGATGTGKTRTLQLIAEQLSAAGVPVFAADYKGDLSGLAEPGAADGRGAEADGRPRAAVRARRRSRSSSSRSAVSARACPCARP